MGTQEVGLSPSTSGFAGEALCLLNRNPCDPGVGTIPIAVGSISRSAPAHESCPSRVKTWLGLREAQGHELGADRPFEPYLASLLLHLPETDAQPNRFARQFDPPVEATRHRQPDVHGDSADPFRVSHLRGFAETGGGGSLSQSGRVEALAFRRRLQHARRRANWKAARRADPPAGADECGVAGMA